MHACYSPSNRFLLPINPVIVFADNLDKQLVCHINTRILLCIICVAVLVIRSSLDKYYLLINTTDLFTSIPAPLSHVAAPFLAFSILLFWHTMLDNTPH
ncbi:hypothetical protein SISNIDRAFT_483842 [Sistotremastrum niveocremeum HHB9708]|uniref:Uncharacterized protein n=1 Tax=Sistotremastrum niveocremeum HHB9708 TaxID=1314777 RepID=A0A164X438_9AGAM|nr:hypothetical protein SISNIDRAFT_483842 [Sistotremastrum niveocremeum HHB9708]